jgi:hypothetical protein
MAAVFITCSKPGSMGPEDATGWLHDRATLLRRAEPVEQVTVRELTPSGRDSLWLVHVMLSSDDDDRWEALVGELVRDLRRLGTRPSVVVDERSGEAATVPAEIERAA